MTATIRVFDESCVLTKTSSAKPAVANAPVVARSAPGPCVVIELDGSRLSADPIPRNFKAIDELTQRYERDPKRRKALERARAALAKTLKEADSLRSIRLRKGLSQSSLGQRVGMPQAHIARLESGRCDPQLSTVMRLAAALDVNPSTLFKVMTGFDSRVSTR